MATQENDANRSAARPETGLVERISRYGKSVIDRLSPRKVACACDGS